MAAQPSLLLSLCLSLSHSLSLSLSLSPVAGVVQHIPRFPPFHSPLSLLFSLFLSSLLSVQRPMGGLNPTMPFSSPLRLTLTKLSAWALVMDVVLYSMCVCVFVCVCMCVCMCVYVCVTAYVNVFFDGKLSLVSYFGLLLGRRIIFIHTEICKSNHIQYIIYRCVCPSSSVYPCASFSSCWENRDF